MTIQRTDKEIIIRFPSSINTKELQDLIDYLSYKEATGNSKTKQNEVDKLSKEIKSNWWNDNKSRLIQ